MPGLGQKGEGRERLGKCLRWLHMCGVDDGGCREERVCVCLCVGDVSTVTNETK